MKLVYTHENKIIVESVRSLLNYEGIEVHIKNEYAASGLGELSAIDLWPEIWVVNSTQYEKAEGIVKKLHNTAVGGDWICSHCNEHNAVAFEVCWNCNKSP